METLAKVRTDAVLRRTGAIHISYASTHCSPHQKVCLPEEVIKKCLHRLGLSAKHLALFLPKYMHWLYDRHCIGPYINVKNLFTQSQIYR